ncbi:MAG: rod shape-determining protein MreC [Tenacibaculum sp.]
MQQLIYFFQRYKNFLFFIFLEIIAVALIINNHSFHKSKFISSTNFITGGIYDTSAEFTEYLNLKERNKTLSEENTYLRNQLEKIAVLIDTTKITEVNDSLYPNQRYKYVNGKIIQNNFINADNFITINRGSKNNITTEMAVINSKGIIGITDNVSNQYARVQSILNSKSRINARFKNSNHYGTLKWNGKNYNTVQLNDIPRQAVFNIGDTIITGGKSTIFPEGILIGTVAKVPEKLSAANTIDINLFNDMTNLGHINIITSLDKKEIKSIQTKNE